MKPENIFDVCIRKKPSKLSCIDNRNLSVDAAASEVLKEKVRKAYGSWKEGELCDVVAELNTIATATWTVENVPNEPSDVAQEISKQSVEGVAWLLLIAYVR